MIVTGSLEELGQQANNIVHISLKRRIALVTIY